jgi:hypothetical protein
LNSLYFERRGEYAGEMIEHALDIHTADGACDAILIRTDDERRHPGVIHLSDIYGLRPAHLELTRRFAELGYVVRSRQTSSIGRRGRRCSTSSRPPARSAR